MHLSTRQLLGATVTSEGCRPYSIKLTSPPHQAVGWQGASVGFLPCIVRGHGRCGCGLALQTTAAVPVWTLTSRYVGSRTERQVVRWGCSGTDCLCAPVPAQLCCSGGFLYHLLQHCWQASAMRLSQHHKLLAVLLSAWDEALQ